MKHSPRDDKEQLKFGKTQLRELLDHYSPLQSVDVETASFREWTGLKTLIKKHRADKLFTVYTELLQSRPEEIKNILPLVEIMVTVSPSMAECERQFSGK